MGSKAAPASDAARDPAFSLGGLANAIGAIGNIVNTGVSIYSGLRQARAGGGSQYAPGGAPAQQQPQAQIPHPGYGRPPPGANPYSLVPQQPAYQPQPQPRPVYSQQGGTDPYGNLYGSRPYHYQQPPRGPSAAPSYYAASVGPQPRQCCACVDPTPRGPYQQQLYQQQLYNQRAAVQYAQTAPRSYMTGAPQRSLYSYAA